MNDDNDIPVGYDFEVVCPCGVIFWTHDYGVRQGDDEVWLCPECSKQ